jgi:hypothetical protein
MILPTGDYRVHWENGQSDVATVIANETTMVALD